MIARLINTIMDVVAGYVALIEIPLVVLLEGMEVDTDRTAWFWLYDIIATVLIFSFLSGLLQRLIELAKRFKKKPALIDEADYDAYVRKPGAMIDEIEASRHPINTIEPLIDAKDWRRVARIYENLNEPAKAGKYYEKDKQYGKAAAQYAKAGETLRAAKLLMRDGDYVAAARFFTTEGKHLKAAQAYCENGSHGAAARAFTQAGKYRKAAEAWRRFFEEGRANSEQRLKGADACYKLLFDLEHGKKVPADLRTVLLEAIAPVFQQARWLFVAGVCYVELGHSDAARNVLTQIPEGDPQYLQARTLLRRCQE